MDTKTAVNDQFSRAAARYKVSQVHAAGEDLQHIAALVQQQPQPRVLDAGCGAGHTALAVAPVSREVVAFDLSQSMLEQVAQLAAERGVTNVETRQGDVEQLPFDGASFDVVVSRYSAHHWPNPARALAECHRVLKPGGRFILSDIVAPEAPVLDTFLQTLELLRDPSHVRDHSTTEWLRLFVTAGFIPRLVTTWPLTLDFEAWTERIGTPDLNKRMLQRLFDTISGDVRTAFGIKPDYSFIVQGALFEGTV